MKKIFWSLAALMLMAAPVLTSCSNALDETVPVEEQSNIVTITIAPPVAEPESRVTMTGNLVTGWELDDEVTLYKVANDYNEIANFGTVYLNGTGVTFKCIDPIAGTFSGDLGSDNIDEYSFAVFGAEAVRFGVYRETIVALVPKTMCSENLKDVVIMAAYKSDSGSYTMQVVNNVMKIKNGTEEDIDAALYGKSYNSNYPTPDFRIPLSGWGYNNRWPGYKAPLVQDIPADYCGWNNAKPFTLKKGVDSYVNMGMFNHPSDMWGIAKQDGTEVVALKEVNGKYNQMGKLFNAGTYTGAPNPVLPGLFTVASSGKGNVKKVRFTKSNLYWDGSAFHFEANPTDYPTTRDANHVGHFFWTKTLANSYASSYNESGDSSDHFFADGSDEAHKLTADGVSGLYVLSNAEWNYLLEHGTCKRGVTVGDKANCLVIAPDGFSGKIKTSYTLEEFNAAGLVCLPAAGYYYLEQVGGYQDYGFYWSSTPDASDDAHIPSFGSSDPQNLRAFRAYGCSIRAVLAE